MILKCIEGRHGEVGSMSDLSSVSLEFEPIQRLPLFPWARTYMMLSTGWYEFNRDFTIKLKYCGSCGRSTQRSNSTFVKYRQNQNQTNKYVRGHYLLKILHKSQNNDSTLYYTLKLFQACFIWTKRLIYVGQLNEESMTISHNFQKQHDQPLLKPNNPR